MDRKHKGCDNSDLSEMVLFRTPLKDFGPGRQQEIEKPRLNTAMNISVGPVGNNGCPVIDLEGAL